MKFNKDTGFIIVHAGVGKHNDLSSKFCAESCKRACEAGIKVLRKSNDSMQAAVAATTCLENCSYTNAGIGSNLSAAETVECDAGIMHGSTMLFTGVGAVPRVPNPITIAQNLIQVQLRRDCQRLFAQPSLLVGDGAYDYAKNTGLSTCLNDDLKTMQSLETYHRCEKLLQTSATDSSAVVEQFDDKLDTVGVVCINDDNIVATSSSGGICMKKPGRVGQAAQIGCGIWAECCVDRKFRIGISSTGCGEALVRCLFAKSCSDYLKFQTKSNDNFIPAQIIDEFFKSNFVNHPANMLFDHSTRFGGAIIVLETEDAKECLWFHNTDCMCVGYMHVDDQNATSFASRNSANDIFKPIINGKSI